MVYLPQCDISINMLSIAELDPFKPLFGNRIVLIKLYVASKASNCVFCYNFPQDKHRTFICNMYIKIMALEHSWIV